MKFGKIKFFAHQASTTIVGGRVQGVERDGTPFNKGFRMGIPIPLFARVIDRAITKHENRIMRAKTRQRRPGPGAHDW